MPHALAPESAASGTVQAEAAALPASGEAVLSFYRQRRATHETLFAVLTRRKNYALMGLVLTALAIGLATVATFRSSAGAAPMILGFGAVVGLVWYLSKAGTGLARETRLLLYYERCVRRVDGSEPQSGRTGTEAGQELRVSGHLYERDLDVLGADSLFGLLCTVRTGPGERGLARYLLEPATHEETLARQEAVKELVAQIELREAIAILGDSSFQQIPGRFFDEWLADTPPTFAPAFRIVLAVTALIAVGLLLSGLMHVLSWGTVFPKLALDLLVQGGLCLLLRGRVTPLLQGGARLESHVKLFSQGLALLQAQRFTSTKLRGLQRLALEPAGAVDILSRLRSQLAIVEQRPKEYFLIFSLLLAAGTQAAIAIAHWKRQHASSMKLWLAAWSEFEALNALATYAFEHPEDCWPELLPPSADPVYKAEGLGHPLLPGAVRNDISLGRDRRFYLISGSNMAGKSTLLRSVGINAVLAYAGAPVRAHWLRLTPVRIGASLALTDSLAEGKSKFLAEVQRLSAIVAQAKSDPVLFLVDEIFSGTNSADRQTAAAAVLTSLLRHGAIGALSTHDLALTELARAGSGGTNVHMASPKADDPLAFDYQLKPGINTSSNALAIIRLMGLDTP